jgi:hypothetical protein
MKKCSKCNIEKEEEEFNFRNKEINKRHDICKSCQSIIRKQSYKKNRKHYLDYEKIHTPIRRRNNRKFIIEYKSGKPCIDCGKVYPHYVMDFDHLPQFKKEIKIAKNGRQFSKKTLIKEFSKCELVCSNCHRERT